MSAAGGPSPSYGGSGDDNSSSSAGSPNTAMIILYSITGIITVLFLVIIITGAVRAHRHPERYGPRYRSGRTRQSRARGIARAMLETIPIVKFGDEAPDSRRDSIKGDVEMSLDPETGDEQNHRKTSIQETNQPAAVADEASTEEKRKSAPAASAAPDTTGNFSCPICTDDFIKGQDLRVLPCNHKFHPECIDPWLVNVSGTCPLCRIDLNPPQAEQPGQDPGLEQEAHEADRPIETPEPARVSGADDDDHHHHHHHRPMRQSRRLTGYLNARRMRDATVEERLAALRSVREEANRHPGGAHEEADEQQRRRHRLSTRLRERLRMGPRPREGAGAGQDQDQDQDQDQGQGQGQRQGHEGPGS